MKFFPALVTLTAFVAAHEGPHDAQGNHLDAQGNIITFSNGTKPAYPIPPTQGGNNSSGNQGGSQSNKYPLPSNQGGNSSSGNQGGNSPSGNQNGGNQGGNKYPTPHNQGGNNSSGNQGGNNSENHGNNHVQPSKPYPTPIPSKLSGSNQPPMEEFQKFLQSPFMQKFMDYMKQYKQKQN